MGLIQIMHVITRCPVLQGKLSQFSLLTCKISVTSHPTLTGSTVSVFHYDSTMLLRQNTTFLSIQTKSLTHLFQKGTIKTNTLSPVRTGSELYFAGVKIRTEFKKKNGFVQNENDWKMIYVPARGVDHDNSLVM